MAPEWQLSWVRRWLQLKFEPPGLVSLGDVCIVPE